jgi:hypothetical protein
MARIGRIGRILLKMGELGILCSNDPGKKNEQQMNTDGR